MVSGTLVDRYTGVDRYAVCDSTCFLHSDCLQLHATHTHIQSTLAITDLATEVQCTRVQDNQPR